MAAKYHNQNLGLWPKVSGNEMPECPKSRGQRSRQTPQLGLVKNGVCQCALRLLMRLLQALPASFLHPVKESSHEAAAHPGISRTGTVHLVCHSPICQSLFCKRGAEHGLRRPHFPLAFPFGRGRSSHASVGMRWFRVRLDPNYLQLLPGWKNFFTFRACPWIGNDDQTLFGAENSWAKIENDGQRIFGAEIRWQGCLQTPALLEQLTA